MTGPIAFLILVVLVAIAGVTVPYIQWRRSWTDEHGGHRIRYLKGVDLRSPEIARLKVAINAIDRKFPGLRPWHVEVCPRGGIKTPTVPEGILPDGSKVGGSVRKEWGVWVAVIVCERTGLFLVHEVVWHIQSHKTYGNGDPLHQKRALQELTENLQRELVGT